MLSANILPWVTEAFHARFPVSVKSLPLVSSAFGRTCVGLLPTKRSSPSHTRKNLWYPGYKYITTVYKHFPEGPSFDTSLDFRIEKAQLRCQNPYLELDIEQRM